MSDASALWTWVHRANIERYRRMMNTPLSPAERRFIEQRIAEEEAALLNQGKPIELPRAAGQQS